MTLINKTYLKKYWPEKIKSLNYITFAINGSFLSKDEAILKINSYKDSLVFCYHFEAVDKA